MALAYNLRPAYNNRTLNLSKQIKICSICILLISLTYLFLYPIPHLFGYNPLSLLIVLQNEGAISEPVIMFLLGSGLIGLARFLRRKFKK